MLIPPVQRRILLCMAPACLALQRQGQSLMLTCEQLIRMWEFLRVGINPGQDSLVVGVGLRYHSLHIVPGGEVLPKGHGVC